VGVLVWWELWLNGSLVWQKVLGLGGSFGLVGAFGLDQFGWEFWFDRSLALHRLGGSFTRSLVGVLELVM